MNNDVKEPWNEPLWKLWYELFTIAHGLGNLELFKSKLNKEVLFYKHIAGGFILNYLISLNNGHDPCYIKAIIDYLPSQDERMLLFSLKSHPTNECVLQIAIDNEDIRVTEMLLQYGANPLMLGFRFDDLVFSINDGNHRMIMLLLRYGAAFHFKYRNSTDDKFGFNLVKTIKTIEVLASSLRIKRLKKGCYLNKEIVRELLHYLI